MDDTERLRLLLRYRGRSECPYTADPGQWPPVRNHPYRTHRPLAIQEFRRRRARTEGEWAETPWLPLLSEGFDLFRESSSLWEADYGPVVGYADLESGRLFLTAKDVDNEPKPADPRLPLLVRAAEIEHDFLKILEMDGTWPRVLVGDELTELMELAPVPRDFFQVTLEAIERENRVYPETARGREPEVKRSRALLAAEGPIYRLWYGRAPSAGVRAEFLLAPEAGLTFLLWACSHGGLPVDATLYREVFPYGSRSAKLRSEYARIEREAALEEDRKHVERILAENPALGTALERLRSAGLPCRKCARLIAAVRAVRVRPDGRVEAECRDCGAHTPLPP